MARNKYPEETVKRILDAAEELFMTRGYENTTMADIVDHLGGLTKGAIYHHFKSKEDIFEAVFERANRGLVAQIDAVARDASLTGLEKIRAFDRITSDGPSSDMWSQMQPDADPIRNARIFAREFVDALDIAHTYIEPAMREGAADGSMRVEYPREVAEVMLVLGNLWMVPLFHPLSSEGEFERRVAVLLKVLRALGVNLTEGGEDDVSEVWRDSWGELARSLAPRAAGREGAGGDAAERGDADAARTAADGGARTAADAARATVDADGPARAEAEVPSSRSGRAGAADRG